MRLRYNVLTEISIRFSVEDMMLIGAKTVTNVHNILLLNNFVINTVSRYEEYWFFVLSNSI